MTGIGNRRLRSLYDIRPLYMIPEDPLAEEVLIPAFSVAGKVDCMVGFFSAEALATLAPGLATYIDSSENSLRLIISPLLREADKVAIEEGLKSEDDVVTDILQEVLVTEDLLRRHTLKCLSWLLKAGRIEIKVALMRDALFHPKVWLFQEDDDIMAVHGSCNVTHSGIRRNIEQIAVAKSWKDSDQDYITKKLRQQFETLWEGKHDSCLVVPLPEAVRKSMLLTYCSGIPPREEELLRLYRKAEERLNTRKSSDRLRVITQTFHIPSNLRYKDGPFAHQGKAVEAWCQAGYRGMLEMATGSGKTITSMIGAYRLWEVNRPLLIIVAAPYVPLIEQWCQEIAFFGLKPVNLAAANGRSARTKELRRVKRRLQLGLTDVEALVVSHDTLCSKDFVKEIESFKCNRLLIADEVHNLGRPRFTKNSPGVIEYRLGLSATPDRQYDPVGTEALVSFFGPVVFSYTLEEAIGHCLVEYDYYVHPVYLCDSEIDDWFELTSKIKRAAWRERDGEPDDYLAKLLRDRRVVLEAAKDKISVLRRLIEGEDTGALRHTLIYASDKMPGQLTDVNRLLAEKGVLFHQLTSEETANRERTNRIIKAFQDGEIQVLTAKRVLDEGVNIPQICKAYILASTTVERQWVQRRGRLLRRCDDIGKTHAVIHDLVALPPNMGADLDPDARALVRSELRRVQEFARLARNAGQPNGPLQLIDEMVRAAYL